MLKLESMKTLRIALFLILGAIYFSPIYAQEHKKEVSKATINMEMVDNNGKKIKIDTSFTVAPNQNLDEIIRQIKEKAGFSGEELANMMQGFNMNVKQFDFDGEDMMAYFDRDSLHKHMMLVREELQNGKGDLKKALEELKVELEGLKMNEEAMKKLDQAMELLHENVWTVNTDQMRDFHKNMNFFMMDGNDAKKQVWVDKDGDKQIIIKMKGNIDGDSLQVVGEKKVIVIGGDFDPNQNIWTDKDGHKIMLKEFKKDGNQVFFGNEKDLEQLKDMDGEDLIIVKKLKGEGNKGDVLVINGNAQVVKEFKDKDGRVKVIRFDSDSDNDNMDMDGNMNFSKKILVIKSATEQEKAKATEKGIFDDKAKDLKLDSFTYTLDDQITTIGAVFDEKGKLEVQLLDSGMNKIWEENAGKVSGEWSTEIPSDIMKDKGVYYLYFKQGNKAKLMKLVNK